MRRSMLGILIALALLVPASAGAVPRGDASTTFSADSLEGHLLVAGESGTGGRIRQLPCGQVWNAVEEYRDLDGDTIWISHWNLTDAAITELIEALDPSISREDIRACTGIYTDGWVPADSDVLAWAEGDTHSLIRITSEGERTCSYGDVLLVSATRWFNEDHWESGRGTGWDEDFSSGPGFVVRGNLAFKCVTIFNPGTDVAHVADAVPSSQVNHNPLVRGLTGLETWLWYDFSQPNASQIGPLHIDVAALGTTWDLTAWAWVDRIAWAPECESDCTYRGVEAAFDNRDFEYSLDLGDTEFIPAAVYDGGAGAEGEAPAEHTYLRKDTYQLSSAAVWRGYYELTVSNPSQGTWTTTQMPYDPIVRADFLDYQVVEIIGVLTG